jgi:hypothetical protein
MATDKPTTFTVDELGELGRRLEARGTNDMRIAARLIKHLVASGELSVCIDGGRRPYIAINDGEGE